MQGCVLLTFVCNWDNSFLATCLMTGKKKFQDRVYHLVKQEENLVHYPSPVVTCFVF